MKLNIKVLFVIWLSVLALSSCSDNLDKSDIKTEGELIGEKLIELTSKEYISKATTYLYYHNYSNSYVDDEEYRKPFEISGQIIKVGSTYYNLNKLIKYKIQKENNSMYLILSFEGFKN